MPRISEMQVNGQQRKVDVDGERTLLSVLRDDLGLTGCKFGCGEGQCAACTVLVDGEPTKSCRMTAGEVGAAKVVTVESLAEGEHLHPVQEAFLKMDALQCGYCTCGMVMGAVALLTKNPSPTREDIVHGMNGHLCRCGVYHRIIAAIEEAAKQMKEAKR